MAHFFGSVAGKAKTHATRLGSEKSGLDVVAASWNGAVKVTLYVCDGIDYALVQLIPWHGEGTTRTLFDGPVSGRAHTLAQVVERKNVA